MVSCIASATSSSFFRYAEATLYMLCTCSSISRQKASLSPFFAFRIKNSFIVVSILLYLTGHQEMLCKSFVYVLLLIRRAKHQKGCRFFHKNFRMQKIPQSHWKGYGSVACYCTTLQAAWTDKKFSWCPA